MNRRLARAAEELRPVVETALGASVIDALFDGYVEAGSVTGAARVVSEWAGMAVPAEVARLWWGAAKALDPTLVPDAITAHSERREERVGVEEALEAERDGVLLEVARVRAAIEGHHCVVCGAPAAGRQRDQTCSQRCALLWSAHRYHLSDDERVIHRRRVAEWNLRNGEAGEHDWAMILGDPTAERGRGILSETVLRDLVEVLRRRIAARADWGDLAADLPPPPALDNQPIIGTATYSA